MVLRAVYVLCSKFYEKSCNKNFQHTSEPAFEAGRVVRGYGAVRCGTGVASNLAGIRAASYKIIENMGKSLVNLSSLAIKQ